jgi:glycosyltransferase involved in cell wall biosynthesis
LQSNSVAALRADSLAQAEPTAQQPDSKSTQGTRVCFVGLGNLPVLAPEYNKHPIGGEQVQQTLLARAFARRGYQVSIVTTDYGQPDGASWDDVQVFKSYAPGSGLPGLRFIHPRWTGVSAALGRANADVYYASCAGALTGQVAMFCRRHKKRFVFRVASDADCVRELPLLKYWRDKKLYEYGLRAADVVLVQSDKQREMLWRNFKVESDYAGMLVDFGEQHLPFSARDYTVLWVNNLRSLKRPDLFLEAARQLGHLSFYMAGGAAPGYQTFYDEFIVEAKSCRNLHVLGQVPYHEVNRLYERARLFVNTSDIEGFPNSYLQAWSRGTPVVAFFDPDNIIEREGLGVAAKTATELAQAIEMLASNEREWQAASNRCQAYMARHFAPERVLDVYRKAVDGADTRGTRFTAETA